MKQSPKPPVDIKKTRKYLALVKACNKPDPSRQAPKHSPARHAVLVSFCTWSVDCARDMLQTKASLPACSDMRHVHANFHDDMLSLTDHHRECVQKVSHTRAVT